MCTNDTAVSAESHNMNLSDRVLEPGYLPTRLSCHSIQPYKTWARYLYNMELRGNMDLYFILSYSIFNSHGYDSRFIKNHSKTQTLC